MRVCVSEREREGCRERIKAGKRKIVRKMEQVNGLKVRERERERERERVMVVVLGDLSPLCVIWWLGG